MGLFGEVTKLLIEEHLTEHTLVAKAIGYRQTIEYLCRPNFKKNDIDALLGFIGEFSKCTRNYAKRQMMWYRKDKEFLWLQVLVFTPSPTQSSRPPSNLLNCDFVLIINYM